MPPKLLAKPDRASGVLPVNAAARAAPSTAPNKPPAARLKLEVRRLPPGLTISEFEDTLGDDWRLGKGRIDWREYRSGKIRSLGKLPEQSRCYVHLANEALVKEFEQRFLAVVFHDKAGTYKNPDLRHLPPTLGYAPNQRVPIQGKQRTDNRQGMIDQDPEFIAFLEAETQPIPKPLALDAIGMNKDDVKVEVKSTPLIDDLRERKANKAKAAANKAERKAGKGDHADTSAATPVKEGGKTAGKGDGKKSEQGAKGATKTSNKQAAAKPAQPSTQSGAAASSSQQKGAATPSKKKKEKTPAATPKQSSSKTSTPTVVTAIATPPANNASPAPQRLPPTQRARRDAEGIKKMLQKDLGIKPKDGTGNAASARSRGAPQAKDSAQGSKAESQTSAKQTATSSNASLSASTPNTTQTPSSSSTAPKAFLKHANPSQGMTEALIQQALSQFGDVTSVSIDPRKGTAIAIFKSVEVLQKAIAARKVTVASGAIEVLEYRDRSGNAGGASTKGTPRPAGRAGRGKGGATASGAGSASASASIPASTPAPPPAPVASTTGPPG